MPGSGSLSAGAWRATAQALRELDPALAIASAGSFEELRAGLVAKPRYTLVVMTAFGAAALLLGILGIYGIA